MMCGAPTGAGNSNYVCPLKEVSLEGRSCIMARGTYTSFLNRFAIHKMADPIGVDYGRLLSKVANSLGAVQNVEVHLG